MLPPHPAQVMASTGVKGKRAAEGVQPSGYLGEFNLNTAQDGGLYSAFIVRAPRPHTPPVTR